MKERVSNPGTCLSTYICTAELQAHAEANSVYLVFMHILAQTNFKLYAHLKNRGQRLQENNNSFNELPGISPTKLKYAIFVIFLLAVLISALELSFSPNCLHDSN